MAVSVIKGVRVQVNTQHLFCGKVDASINVVHFEFPFKKTWCALIPANSAEDKNEFKRDQLRGGNEERNGKREALPIPIISLCNKLEMFEPKRNCIP